MNFLQHCKKFIYLFVERVLVMNIHDSGYKKLFSNRTIFRQLLETFVNQEWVHSLDCDNCETLDKSFISEHYKETESDLIYKVQFHDREVYIYIPIEFQSTVEPFMALRVLNYITNFYMDFLVNNRGASKLPPSFQLCYTMETHVGRPR